MAEDRKLPVLERTGLHARRLVLEHPVSRQNLELEAPYPPDFSQALAYLRSVC